MLLNFLHSRKFLTTVIRPLSSLRSCEKIQIPLFVPLFQRGRSKKEGRVLLGKCLVVPLFRLRLPLFGKEGPGEIFRISLSITSPPPSRGRCKRGLPLSCLVAAQPRWALRGGACFFPFGCGSAALCLSGDLVLAGTVYLRLRSPYGRLPASKDRPLTRQ
jgi:hypothetical protein